MSKQNWIRVTVLAAVFAWPAVETYKYVQATKELAASQVLEQKVSQRLAAAKETRAVARAESPNTQP